LDQVVEVAQVVLLRMVRQALPGKAIQVALIMVVLHMVQVVVAVRVL
jgi:hypothetical protein